MDNKISLPILKFEDTNEVLANSNFHKVKILIMHTGLNLNNSIFSNESIENSIHTLSNIPILSYVEKDEGQDNKDFAGHEIDYDVFTDENGDIKIREYYKEQPIGVIPETNDYFTIEMDGETYLGCYGYIWKCYSNDSFDILREDEEKEVSMEILINNCSYDKDNRCNIDKFEFLGVTCLGSKHPGAMGRKCTINMNFSTDDENKEFVDTVVKLNKMLKFEREESVDIVEENNKQVETQEFAEEKDVCPECGENPCICDKEDNVENEEKKNEKCEEDDVKEVEDDKEDEACKKKCEVEEVEVEFAEKEEDEKEKCEEDVCPECGKNPCECDKEEESCKKKKCEEDEVEVEEDKKKKCEVEKEDFSLSLNNIFREVSRVLDEYTFEYTSFWGDVYEARKYYAEDLIPTDNVIVVYDNEDNEHYGVVYRIDNDSVSLDLENKKVYISEWRAKVEGEQRLEIAKFDAKKEMSELVGKEIQELKQFKSDIENQIKEQELDNAISNVLAKFEFEVEETEELVNKVKDNKIDIDMFETLLYALEGKKYRAEKEKFSAVNVEKENSLNIYEVEEEPKQKGKYSDILDKYGKK